MAELAGRPRAVVAAAIARVRWLVDQPQDLETLISRDSMPDELADMIREGAETDDVSTILDLIEDAALSSEARSAAVQLLGWIDRESDVVTDRMIEWLREQDTELEYLVSKVLRETRDPDIFRRRAERILAAEPPIEVAELLIEAREPMWIVGSERVVLRRVATDFDAWASAENERLAAVGRTAAARFRERAARADGADEDPDAEGG
jgi:hypothetical protein